MPNNWFQFKQFKIEQQHAAMKISTDSIVFGASVKFKTHKKILDIGSGTGILTLMAAQKSNAAITAVEIDKDSYHESMQNIQNSKWANRIKVINSSIQGYAEKCHEKFDLILTNPPFFENDLLSPKHSKKIAKHTTLLKLDELLHCAASLLSQNGMFWIIFPAQSSRMLIEKAETMNLFPKLVISVYPNEKKPVSRDIMCFCRESAIPEQKEIYIRKGNKYSQEYRELTEEFYL